MLKAAVLLAFLTYALALVRIDVVVNSNITGSVYVQVTGKDVPPFILNSTYTKQEFYVKEIWTGTIFGRSDCRTIDECKSNRIPSTKVDFNVGQEVTYYDLDISEGYNLGLTVEALSGRSFNTTDCQPISCSSREILNKCPSELRFPTENSNNVVACQGACTAFKSDEYCCRGKFESPNDCLPTNWTHDYPKFFKTYCPNTYTYSLERGQTVRCSAKTFVVRFDD